MRGILGGGDTAKTEFLRERAGGSLREGDRTDRRRGDRQGRCHCCLQVAPRAGPMARWAGFGSLGGLAKTDRLDLDSYVTGKTLDGLFLKLAAEEKAIRENPVARSTELLKTVFGR